MNRFWRAYLSAIEAVCLTGIACVLVVGTLQVFYRYVLGASLFWSEELMRYAMLWVVAIGAGLAFTRGQFLGMRLLVEILPERLRRVLDFVSAALILVFLAIVIVYGFQFAWGTRAQGAIALGISMFWIHGSIVVCAVLLAVHVFVRDFLGVDHEAGRDPHDLGAEDAL